MKLTHTWLVWSYEHEAWWRPGRLGYTQSIVLAGHYTRDEAEKIEQDANRYAETPHEQAIPLFGEIEPISERIYESFSRAIRERDALVFMLCYTSQHPIDAD